MNKQNILVITLAMACGSTSAPAQSQAADAKSTPIIYQTLYLTNLTQQNDAIELVTDLRNMLPNAKLYYVPSQSAFSIRASAEEIALAQKILADLDKTKKIYRLTYTMTERDGGKTIGVQHFSIIVASGSRTDFKQGSRVPIGVGGRSSASSTSNLEVQYLDVGLNLEASLDGDRLRTKAEQTSVAEEKSGIGLQDPIVRQTMLEATSDLVPGKTLVLGSLDIPGTSRHQEIEALVETVQ